MAKMCHIKWPFMSLIRFCSYTEQSSRTCVWSSILGGQTIGNHANLLLSFAYKLSQDIFQEIFICHGSEIKMGTHTPWTRDYYTFHETRAWIHQFDFSWKLLWKWIPNYFHRKIKFTNFLKSLFNYFLFAFLKAPPRVYFKVLSAWFPSTIPPIYWIFPLKKVQITSHWVLVCLPYL